MCGFVALIRPRSRSHEETSALVTATRLVRHRGPDDEGYLLWDPLAGTGVFAGDETTCASREEHRLADVPGASEWQIAFGHRRLSILDLTPAGHQPMLHRASGLAVIYNGEIYNFVELRGELEQLGHAFDGHSDTEVLLAAWAEWGPECVARFNGMFAFVLFDPRSRQIHAVRDRFGIKPLYWARVSDRVVFASEIKQIRSLPQFAPRLDLAAAYDYLSMGRHDHSARTFDEGVFQLRGGERAIVAVDDPSLTINVERWYEAPDIEWSGNDGDAVDEFLALLTDSVRISLRSDVALGSCLSGGLDSSSIVCLARRLLEQQDDHEGQITVTACFDDPACDEWSYAEQVARRAGSHAVRVWPTAEQLQRDFERQLWFMDEPYDGTSQFSQWCVFEGVAASGLKVVLDGQGSDEHLAGYDGSTTTAFLEGLLRRSEYGSFVREAFALSSRRSTLRLPEVGLALGRTFPLIGRALSSFRTGTANGSWLKYRHVPAIGPTPGDLSASLRLQAGATSLPALLRYEDRNSMAYSVEARVPFLDHRLTEFLGSLPDRFKIQSGVRKAILRDSMRGVLPEPVRMRTDKLGFATPELAWLRQWDPHSIQEAVSAAIDMAPDLFNPDATRRVVLAKLDGSSQSVDPGPFRIISLGYWLRSVSAGELSYVAAGTHA